LTQGEKGVAKTPKKRRIETTSSEKEKDRIVEIDKKLQNSEPKQEQKVYEERETVSIGSMSYTVLRTWWSDRLSNKWYHRDEKPDAMYLFVELAVGNNDKIPRRIPSLILIDGKYREHGEKISGLVEGELETLDSLNPGVRRNGIIVFDVHPQRYMLKVSGGFLSFKSALILLSPKQRQKPR